MHAQGDLVEVFEQRPWGGEEGKGKQQPQMRVRCEQGWASLTTGTGVAIMAPVAGRRVTSPALARTECTPLCNEVCVCSKNASGSRTTISPCHKRTGPDSCQPPQIATGVTQFTAAAFHSNCVLPPSLQNADSLATHWWVNESRHPKARKEGKERQQDKDQGTQLAQRQFADAVIRQNVEQRAVELEVRGPACSHGLTSVFVSSDGVCANLAPLTKDCRAWRIVKPTCF